MTISHQRQRRRWRHRYAVYAHTGRASGQTHLRMEQFKQWQREVYPRDQLKDPPQMEHWLCLIDIIRHMWFTGEITQDLVWNVIVLIPKGNTDKQDIGLLDTLWKVVEVLIDTHIYASLQLQDVLHRFRSIIGTCIAITELKFTQELSSID